MKKLSLAQRHRSEKTIIDALLKISQVVQKIEASRKRPNSAYASKHSRSSAGDGDYTPMLNNNQQEHVPVPPSMRTLDSYISGFNHQSIQQPSNCNHASIHKPRQHRCHPSSAGHECERPRRHCCSDSSSDSSSDHRPRKSLRLNENLEPVRYG